MMNESERRKYWTETMDAAYDFVKRAAAVPVSDCLEKLVYLPDAVEEAGVDVGFSSKPHVDNLPRLYYLREGLLEDFLKTASAMNSQGWTMRVEDGFRTRQMQRRNAHQPFAIEAILKKCHWELQGAELTQDLLFKRIAPLVALWPSVATHMSGSAIDISVMDRQSGRQIDRGGDFLEMSELTPMDSPFISETAQANRKAITRLFNENGFVAYPYEFWHYSRGDAFDAIINKRASARYGAVEWIRLDNSVKPMKDQQEPLTSERDFLKMAKAIEGRDK